MNPTFGVLVVLGSALVACSDGQRMQEGLGSATVTAVAASSAEEPYVQLLKEFATASFVEGVGCGALSVTNGKVQLDASESDLPRFRRADADVTAELVLVAQFGSGFPGRDCTDIPDEVRYPTVDETWPATATEAHLTVTPSDQCAVATLELAGVTVVTPSGDSIDVGDVIITNPQWQWWHPFECQLSEPTAAADQG